jgi:hypothetical protein
LLSATLLALNNILLIGLSNHGLAFHCQIHVLIPRFLQTLSLKTATALFVEAMTPPPTPIILHAALPEAEVMHLSTGRIRFNEFALNYCWNVMLQSVEGITAVCACSIFRLNHLVSRPWRSSVWLVTQSMASAPLLSWTTIPWKGL